MRQFISRENTCKLVYSIFLQKILGQSSMLCLCAVCVCVFFFCFFLLFQALLQFQWKKIPGEGGGDQTVNRQVNTYS